jgi:FkbM family methyltransferase
MRSWPRLVADILAFRLLRLVTLPRADSTRTVAMLDGALLTYRLNRGDIQAIREIWLDEVYMPPHEAYSMRTVIDLGANIGFTSVYLARRLRPSRLVAVEPDPDNVAILRRNLAQNGIEAVVIEAAIGPADGSARFRRNTSSNLGSLAADGDLTVAVVSVPTVLERLGPSPQRTLLKLDIEGGEEQLFGADVGWLDRVGCLLAELHPTVVDTERILALLERSGLAFRLGGGPGRPPACWVRASDSATPQPSDAGQ